MMNEEKDKEKKTIDRKPFIYAIVAIIIPFGILTAGVVVFMRYMKGKKMLVKKKEKEKDKEKE